MHTLGLTFVDSQRECMIWQTVTMIYDNGSIQTATVMCDNGNAQCLHARPHIRELSTGVQTATMTYDEEWPMPPCWAAHSWTLMGRACRLSLPCKYRHGGGWRDSDSGLALVVTWPSVPQTVRWATLSPSPNYFFFAAIKFSPFSIKKNPYQIFF